jgi:hypothetical protein
MARCEMPSLDEIRSLLFCGGGRRTRRLRSALRRAQFAHRSARSPRALAVASIICMECIRPTRSPVETAVLQLTMPKNAGNCSRPHVVTLTRPLQNKVISGLSADNNITLTALLLHLDTERGKEKHTEYRAFRRRFPSPSLGSPPNIAPS